MFPKACIARKHAKTCKPLLLLPHYQPHCAHYCVSRYIHGEERAPDRMPEGGLTDWGAKLPSVDKLNIEALA